jgi:hypothetical protein
MSLKRAAKWFDGERKFLHTPVGIFLLGAFLGELSPDPTDALHFWLQSHVFNHPEVLSGPWLVALQIFDWYLLTASYFLFLLIMAYVLHIRQVSTVKRITIVGGVLGVGAAIGIIARILLGS